MVFSHIASLILLLSFKLGILDTIYPAKLELKTGGDASYIWLGLTVLLILAGGITLIKRYVI